MTQTNYNERLDELVGNICTRDKSLNRIAVKQALTQLFKDLVAEAKPTKGRWHTHSEIALTQSCDICDQFEQNLLRLLGPHDE